MFKVPSLHRKSWVPPFPTRGARRFQFDRIHRIHLLNYIRLGFTRQSGRIPRFGSCQTGISTQPCSGVPEGSTKPRSWSPTISAPVTAPRAWDLHTLANLTNMQAPRWPPADLCQKRTSGRPMADLHLANPSSCFFDAAWCVIFLLVFTCGGSLELQSKPTVRDSSNFDRFRTDDP